MLSSERGQGKPKYQCSLLGGAIETSAWNGWRTTKRSMVWCSREGQYELGVAWGRQPGLERLAVGGVGPELGSPAGKPSVFCGKGGGWPSTNGESIRQDTR